MIPLQLHSLLSEVTSALRREHWSASPDGGNPAANHSFSKTAADYMYYADDGDGGDNDSLSVFMSLSAALLVLCLVGSASAAAAACCTLWWTKKGTGRPKHGRAPPAGTRLDDL